MTPIDLILSVIFAAGTFVCLVMILREIRKILRLKIHRSDPTIKEREKDEIVKIVSKMRVR